MTVEDVVAMREAATAALNAYKAAVRDPLALARDVERAKKRFSRAHRAWLEAAADAIAPEFANGAIGSNSTQAGE